MNMSIKFCAKALFVQFIKDDLHHLGIFAAGAIGSSYYRKSLVFPAPASNAGEASNASNAGETS